MMEQETINAATWGWLLIPMLSVVLLSLITFFTERGE